MYDYFNSGYSFEFELYHTIPRLGNFFKIKNRQLILRRAPLNMQSFLHEFSFLSIFHEYEIICTKLQLWLPIFSSEISHIRFLIPSNEQIGNHSTPDVPSDISVRRKYECMQYMLPI